HPTTQYDGAGIGLTIVREATDAWGAGRLRVGAGQRQPILDSVNQSIRIMRPILHVENDANDVFFLQHALTEAGIANPVRVANDGQQAIEYLQCSRTFGDCEEFPLPCLILLDLKLPYVTGLDVLKWIRRKSGMS